MCFSRQEITPYVRFEIFRFSFALAIDAATSIFPHTVLDLDFDKSVTISWIFLSGKELGFDYLKRHIVVDGSGQLRRVKEKKLKYNNFVFFQT